MPRRGSRGPGIGEGLTDPVPYALGRALRQAVLDHVTTERRRVFPPVVHLGRPGCPVATLALDERPIDQALRTDVLEALHRRLRGANDDESPLVWLTRRGNLEVQDIDLGWSSAARAASLELEVPLPMVVVTRQGWRDPRTGVTRTWRRLRPARR